MKRSLTCCRFFPDALSLNAGFSRTLLLRGALVTGVLAIIAGILGMHVLTGNHAAHGDHAAALQAEGGHSDTGHAEAEHVGAVHLETVHAEAVRTVASDITSCAGSCHRVQESGTSCVPSANSSALTLCPPSENRVVFPAAQGGHTGPAAAYAHTPPSPTPCELSISRT